MATAAWSDYYTPDDTAVSESARIIRQQFEAASDPERSLSLGAIERMLTLAAEEALEDGTQVDAATLSAARRLSRLIPLDAPLPDVAVAPDGEILFEWCTAPRMILTLSINGNGRVAYAGLYGALKVHGIDQLSMALPRPVQDGLRLLYSGSVLAAPTLPGHGL